MTYEDIEQIHLMDWARLQQKAHPELELLFHIANERKSTPAAGQWMKQKGVKAGVPDLCLPVARNGKHGLWIELKRAGGGRLSEAQKEWLDRLRDEGYEAKVCHGFDEARKAIEEYLQW